jgi:hypothetical protein
VLTRHSFWHFLHHNSPLGFHFRLVQSRLVNDYSLLLRCTFLSRRWYIWHQYTSTDVSTLWFSYTRGGQVRRYSSRSGSSRQDQKQKKEMWDWVPRSTTKTAPRGGRHIWHVLLYSTLGAKWPGDVKVSVDGSSRDVSPTRIDHTDTKCKGFFEWQ